MPVESCGDRSGRLQSDINEKWIWIWKMQKPKVLEFTMGYEFEHTAFSMQYCIAFDTPVRNPIRSHEKKRVIMVFMCYLFPLTAPV